MNHLRTFLENETSQNQNKKHNKHNIMASLIAEPDPEFKVAYADTSDISNTDRIYDIIDLNVIFKKIRNRLKKFQSLAQLNNVLNKKGEVSETDRTTMQMLVYKIMSNYLKKGSKEMINSSNLDQKNHHEYDYNKSRVIRPKLIDMCDDSDKQTDKSEDYSSLISNLQANNQCKQHADTKAIQIE